MTDDSGASQLQQAALAAERLLADIQREKLELAHYPRAAVAEGADALDGVADAARSVLAAIKSQLQLQRSLNP